MAAPGVLYSSLSGNHNDNNAPSSRSSTADAAKFMSHKHLIAIIAGCAWLSACSSQPTAPTGSAFSGASESRAAAAPAGPTYVVSRGDELNFRFFYTPELNTVAIVRPDGYVALPLAGEVLVDGATPAEIGARVEALLADKVRRPQVTINVNGANSQRVFVGGEVVHPGVQSLAGRLTVLQAVMAAEGLRESAQPREVAVIHVARDGRPSITKVDLEALMAGRKGAQDYVLGAQDVVVVPRSGIAKLDLWIDQYVRRAVPISFGLTYSINHYGIVQ